MYPNEFGDPLTFHLAPSLGQSFNLSNILVYDEILEKLDIPISLSWRTMMFWKENFLLI